MSTKTMELKEQGYCCAQIIMQIGLDHMGKENPDLIAAMEGLCDGAHQGEICGALSGAICFLYLWNRELAVELGLELSQWFEEAYGSVRCTEILHGNPLNKPLICGDLVENTHLKLMDMIEDYE